VTAANASKINDGAAGLVLASARAVERCGLEPRARQGRRRALRDQRSLIATLCLGGGEAVALLVEQHQARAVVV
jgi:acetyl-CoA acetyltransferase